MIHLQQEQKKGGVEMVHLQQAWNKGMVLMIYLPQSCKKGGGGNNNTFASGMEKGLSAVVDTSPENATST